MKDAAKRWRVAVATDPQSGYGRDTIEGCIQYLEEMDSPIELTLICDGFGDPEVLAQPFDAFLLSGRSLWISPYISAAKPVVHLDLPNPQPVEYSISSDADATGNLAADLLWERGVAAFGYCQYYFPPESGAEMCNAGRLQGFQRGLAERGIAEAAARVQRHTLGTTQALLDWIDHLPRPAGIFAFNDKVALEIVQACALLRLQVPHEISVVGVDNDALVCNLMHPSITSIDINLAELAHQGLSVLTHLLEGTAPHNKHAVLPVENAYLRESTGHFSTTVDHRLIRAVRYIHEHAHQGISVADVVKVSGLGHRTLELLFKEQLGRTPQEELIQARHRYCLKELRVNQSSIVDLSADLGMSHSSFYRTFKKMEGCTPAEYRDYYFGGDAPVRQMSRRNPDLIQIGMISSFQWKTSRDFMAGATAFAQTEPGLNLILHDTDRVTSFAEHIWYDGAVVVCGHQYPENANPNTPTIYHSYKQANAAAGNIQVDESDIGRLAGRHFIRKGHVHFAYYIGFDIHEVPPRDAASELLDHRSRDRYEGFRAALDEAGLKDTPIHRYLKETASESCIEWLRSLPKPVALFCFNDQLALQSQMVCLTDGLRVPEDVSILGVDNDPSLCRLAHPSLSSIDVGFARIGAYTLKQFVGCLRKEHPPADRTFPAQMVHARESTAGLAVADPALVLAVAYIEQHFQTPMSVMDVAQAAGIERRPLEMRFKKHLRSTPGRYLQETRLIHAETRLIYSSDRISEIAEQCGFKQTNHFCRVFKQQYGITPREFKAQRGALTKSDSGA